MSNINSQKILAAQPYTYKVYGEVDKDGKPSFCKVPVIAWYIRAESFTHNDEPNDHIYSFPVTPGDDGNAWDPQANEAIMYPCGTVVVQNGGTYENVNEWMIYCFERFIQL